MATTATLLTSVESAISTLLSGGAQARSLADRRWEGLSLQQLFDVREKLKAEIAGSSTSTTYAEFEDTQ